MFISTKKAFLFTNGNDEFLAPRNFIGEAPEWIKETPIFKLGVKENSIIIPESKTDKTLQDIDDKPVKVKRTKD